MRSRLIDLVNRVHTGVLLTAVVMLVPIVLLAQAPSSATGVGAAMPRTPEGKPDLSGVWQVMNTAAVNVEPHHALKDEPAGQGVVEGGAIPYQPWALKKQQENYANRVTADPVAKCYLPGIPRVTYMPYPFQIAQTPKQIALLYEWVHATRNVYMDSKHPPGPIDWWMGDSRATWDGDTLVVDVVHFNEETWFDHAGNFHSDALHVVERYTPIDRNHIRYDVTIEDPKVFTRPWKMSMPLYRRVEANVQVLEYECYAFDGEEFHVTPPQ
jgi:hypothetical protein